ncbi:reverse transcriptase domain-containing protein [Tanacetum coccineum]
MSKYGVTHRLSTPYTSQTSVKVEVHNRGLKNLERTVGENRASWSNKLDNALWAFKTAYKTPIRCTPYKLVYGKACHLPVSDRVKADGRRSYKEKEHNIEPSAAGEWVAWGILCTSLQSVIRDMGDSTTVVAYLGVWGRERASASLRPAVLGQTLRGRKIDMYVPLSIARGPNVKEVDWVMIGLLDACDEFLQFESVLMVEVELSRGGEGWGRGGEAGSADMWGWDQAHRSQEELGRCFAEMVGWGRMFGAGGGCGVSGTNWVDVEVGGGDGAVHGKTGARREGFAIREAREGTGGPGGGAEL